MLGEYEVCNRYEVDMAVCHRFEVHDSAACKTQSQEKDAGGGTLDESVEIQSSCDAGARQ